MRTVWIAGAFIVAVGCSSFGGETSGEGGTSSTTGEPTTMNGSASLPTSGSTEPAGGSSESSSSEGDTTSAADSSTTSASDSSSTTAADGSSSSGGLQATCDPRALPDEPATVCSESSQQDAILTITNNCAATVRVYWVAYFCEESPNLDIEPGDTRVIETFESHPFRIRDLQTGGLLLETPPMQAGPNVFTVP